MKKESITITTTPPQSPHTADHRFAAIGRDEMKHAATIERVFAGCRAQPSQTYRRIRLSLGPRPKHSDQKDGKEWRDEQARDQCHIVHQIVEVSNDERGATRHERANDRGCFAGDQLVPVRFSSGEDMSGRCRR